jgi:acyl-CoA thioesterase-2
LHYRVERLRDGRSFAHRRVTASQDGRSVFCADVSLHDEEPTMPSHAAPMPQVSAPEGLATLDELLAQHGERMSRQGDERILLKRRVELRPVDAVSGIVQPGAEARSTVWLQALLAGPLAPLDHYAALAYLSDYWANASSRIVHGRVLFSGEISSASLNHAIWFHRRPDVSGPLLYTLDSPSTHGGTGFNRGLIYQRDGRLIASTTQEALTRRLR